MTRSRMLNALLLAVALVAVPAIAAAATVTATGTSTGSATALPPTAEAACDPPGATVPADYICDFDIAGSFDLTELGVGTYTGSTRVDWSIYTGTEPCAELTGTMVLTTADGSLTLEMANTSRVCETADPLVHTSSMDATVVSGTGAYAGATGSFTGAGTLSATATAGEYDAAQDLDGSVTVPDPTPAPTGTPAPTASDSATPSPSADQVLPDTSSTSTGATLPMVLVLGGLLAASVAVRGFSARRT